MYKDVCIKTCTFKLFFSSFFLIQFNACCWGSIQRGYLLQLVVRIPFWIDSSSGGRDFDVHLLISTSLVNNVSNLNDLLRGVSHCVISDNQSSNCFWLRYRSPRRTHQGNSEMMRKEDSHPIVKYVSVSTLLIPPSI